MSASQAGKPDSYLVWAVLSTVLCCLPLGIVSIVYASRVDRAWYEGRVNEAYESSRKAKTWAWASAGVSLALSLVYAVAVVLFAASQ